MSLNIAILNCYADEPTSAPSASIFAKHIPDTKIINVCFDEQIGDIHDFDGYIVSGSHSGHKDKEVWINDLRMIIREIHSEDIPCLAVCFGHQVVAHTFNGTTVRSLAGEEGFQNIPTMAGDNIIRLFADISNPVKVFQSHKDAVMKPPKGSINTIYNDKCVQYYEYGSIYSIQSHPEISVQTALEIAKKEGRETASFLNGVTEKNCQSQKIIENFYNIVKYSE